MSNRSYANSPHGVTAEWKIEFNEEAQKFYVSVPDDCNCGCPKCKGIVYRPHTDGTQFEEYDEAHEWIEGVQIVLDDDYEDYYNENSYSIAQMERYEMFRNEY